MIKNFTVQVAIEDKAFRDFLVDYIEDELARILKEGAIEGDNGFSYEIYDATVKEQ